MARWLRAPLKRRTHALRPADDRVVLWLITAAYLVGMGALGLLDDLTPLDFPTSLQRQMLWPLNILPSVVLNLVWVGMGLAVAGTCWLRVPAEWARWLRWAAIAALIVVCWWYGTARFLNGVYHVAVIVGALLLVYYYAPSEATGD